MSAFTDIADYHWLTGQAAAQLIETVSSDLSTGRTTVVNVVDSLRRCLSPTRTHLLIELLELRRRAAAKFDCAERMFFTRIALQQATDQWVAAYKATRLAELRAGSSSQPLVADLCCGIGGDLLALARQGPVVAVDCDPIATHFATANLHAVCPHTDAVIYTADVRDFDLNDVTVFHIDPDRRAAGRRTTTLEACQPDLDTTERLLRRVPDGAVKLAPSTTAPPDWAERCELEWISRGGECRQQVAWHGNLAVTPGQRRATIVGDDSVGRDGRPIACGLAKRTIVGPRNRSVPLATELDQYVFDIDPAVLASHLQGALAAEHRLSGLSHGPTYLTGPVAIADPALDCFAVEDVLPLRLKVLAAHLRQRGIGRLEIKKRGIELAPERLREDLKLRGDNGATLLITPIGGRPTAILAQRVCTQLTDPTASTRRLLESAALSSGKTIGPGEGGFPAS